MGKKKQAPPNNPPGQQVGEVQGGPPPKKGKKAKVQEAALVEAPQEVKERAGMAATALDETQILNEAQGRFAGEMAYRYTEGGHEVTGLTYTGVKHVFRKIHGKLPRGYQVKWTEEAPSARRDNLRVFVCEVTADEGYGVAEQPEAIRTRAGTYMPDYHAKTKAFSKAFRNMLRMEIPEKEYIALLEGFLKKKGQVATLTADNAKATVDTDVRRKAQLGRLHSIAKALGIQVNIESHKEALHATLDAAYNKRLSEMPEDELRMVGDDLYSIQQARNYAPFIEAVSNTDPEAYKRAVQSSRQGVTHAG